jgi:hypothetical protein
VFVGGQQRQSMIDASLGQQRVAGSHLDARTATRFPQFGGRDMVFAARLIIGSAPKCSMMSWQVVPPAPPPEPPQAITGGPGGFADAHPVGAWPSCNAWLREETPCAFMGQPPTPVVRASPSAPRGVPLADKIAGRSRFTRHASQGKPRGRLGGFEWHSRFSRSGAGAWLPADRRSRERRPGARLPHGRIAVRN